MKPAQRTVLGLTLVLVALGTVRWVTDPAQKGWPSPKIYLSGAIVGTLMYGLADVAPSLAVAALGGLDIGILMQPFVAGHPAASPLNTLTSWLGAAPSSASSQTSSPPSPGGYIAGQNQQTSN